VGTGMSQIRVPVGRRTAWRGEDAGRRVIDLLVVAALIALVYGIVRAAARWSAPLSTTPSIDTSYSALPRYAGLSTARMAAAYALSIVFSIAYARLAATSRLAERIMLPILDILQSVPILSFLPGVVLALVALFPHSNVGLELSAILLIFTSQAWNLAFSFHQSLLTIPAELKEAAAIYRLNAWRRFTKLELPFGTIPLVWNSMMSWAGGWFFLMAAEQFTLGSHNFQLPGLGSYLQTAANAGNTGQLVAGILTLIVIIVLLDQLVWRPAIAWSDRFKVEPVQSANPPTSFVLQALRRSAVVAWIGRHLFAPLGRAVDRAFARLLPETEQAAPPAAARARHRLRARSIELLLVSLLAAVIVLGTIAALRLLGHLSSDDGFTIAGSTLATLIRTATALVIATAWTVPVGVAIGTNPRLARIAQPLVQMVASIPATALFPALLVLLIGLPGGLNVAAVGLMLLGTQWYVLFNVIAGAMAIPTDLREVAAVHRLSGWRRWRLLILPAIFPYLVTGMITATGGAWNASIVAEYVSFKNHVYSTVGLGALIARSAGEGNYALLLGGTLAMAATVVLINRLLWRPLYRLAEQRYRLD
jgi:NitT/TauT family transport system permease protein